MYYKVPISVKHSNEESACSLTVRFTVRQGLSKGAVIHTLDYLIIIMILSGFVAYGILQSFYNRTASDYFIGNRRVPWSVAMFSIVATETSVLTFVSIPGLAYREDWFFLQIALGYIIGRILVSVLFLPKYFESGIISIYEVVGRRFGPGMQKSASLVFLITRILADGVRFLSTGVVVQVVTGWPLWVAICLIGGVTLVYTLLGGIRTILWVDSFQFVLYLLGAIISIVFLVNHIHPDAWEAFRQIVAAGKTRIFHFDGVFLFDVRTASSAIIGGMVLSLASHGVDHMMVQRALACRNLKSAQRAMIGSGIFVFVQFMLFLLVGSLIYIYYNGAGMETDREFAFFIVNELPVGLKGLLLAGVLGAAMSTLSSSINSLASSFMTDWLKSRVTLRLSQAVSFVFAAIVTSVALFFDESDNAVIMVGLEIASFTYGGLLGLFLLARGDKKYNTPSLVAGFAGSLLTVAALKHL
ncbi:MAG: sodium:solute symporter, partial [Acidobacteriota bacterium]